MLPQNSLYSHLGFKEPEIGLHVCMLHILQTYVEKLVGTLMPLKG